MLEINEELVEYLSDLSRVGLKDSEKKNILIDLKKILTFFKELEEVDTSDIEPTYTIFAELEAPQREDEVGVLFPRDEFLKNAPSSLGGMVTIPPLFG
jgi:aspartyl-tRNA(Asn)/glutamyl-tRNA(Gln) amidotransferase subunit C